MPAPVPPAYRTPGPLTNDQIATLMKRGATDVYMDFVPLSAVSATARIASSNTFTDTLADIDIDRKSDNWDADVFDDMTVFIGTTAGACDVGIYRVRTNDNPDILKIGETAAGDPGLRPLMKLTSIAADQYITVLLVERNVWAALTRIVYEDGVATFYKDYDQLYTGQNQHPPADLRLGSHFATFVDPGFDYATVRFRPEAKVWTGAVISYQWILPDGATVTSGSASGSISTFTGDGAISEAWITVQLPVGFHVVRLFIERNGGSIYITNAYRFVWVHDGVGPDATFPPYSVSSGGLRKDRVGWEITANLVGDDISNHRLSSVAHCWKIMTYNDVHPVDLGRAEFQNEQYTGWITSIDLAPGENGTRDATVHLESVTKMLDRLPTSSLVFNIVSGTPARWDQVNEGNCNTEFWLKYVFDWHAPNLGSLFDFNYYTTGTDQIYTAPGLTSPSGSLLNAVQNIVRRSNLNCGVDSNGRFWLRPHPSRIVYSNRTTDKIPVRMTLTPAHYSDIKWSQSAFMSQRRVDADGFMYDSTPGALAERPVPLSATSPGATWAQGTATQMLASRLVKDQLELNFVAGAEEAILNNPYGTITLQLPGSWDVFDPAHLSFVTMTIPNTYNPLNKSESWRTILLSYSERWLGNGVMDAEVTGEPEAAGQPGIADGVIKKIKPPPPPPPPPPPSGLWTVTLDFLVKSYGPIWVVHHGDGWAEGVGWYMDDVFAGPAVNGLYEMTGDAAITSLKFFCKSESPTAEIKQTELRIFGLADEYFTQGFPLPSGVVDFTADIAPSRGLALVSGLVRLTAYAQISGSINIPNVVSITKVIISGTGVKPDFGQDL